MADTNRPAVGRHAWSGCCFLDAAALLPPRPASDPARRVCGLNTGLCPLYFAPKLAWAGLRLIIPQGHDQLPRDASVKSRENNDAPRNGRGFIGKVREQGSVV